MLFLVVERFRGGDPEPVYERFATHGRLAPEGLHYVGSWVSADLTHCYQVMEASERSLLDRWVESWADLVDFEVVEVVTSAAAAAAVAKRRDAAAQANAPRNPQV